MSGVVTASRLIELLVVIAIIAVLIALLICPLFKRRSQKQPVAFSARTI